MTSQQGTGFVGISNYIKTSLIPAVTSIRITNIYDNEVTDLKGYPSVTITASNLDGKFLDTNRNERRYRFSIKLFIDRNQQNFGTQKAETILRTALDEMVNIVDADPTLNGNCIYTRPFVARPLYVDRQNNNLRVAELILECTDAVTFK